MNKHLYRIVYNHALGLFQVVSELVRRPGGGASANDASMTTATVRPVSLSLWVAFGWIGFASLATAGQIVTDPNAPGNQRPTVLGSSGAAPLINITTPSKAGVSRNTYSDFSVDSAGVVLNNSRTNTTTQLAGTVAGNPWLATGTAKVILNEVSGSNPSALNGYLEVAGDRAQVIIANPAGISCDGCGVINANRFTLTTGTPELNGGALDGYRVTGGAVQIGPNGLDATRADYTDIIARAVQVNGGIWSPQLQVTTGSNQVNADQSQVTAITGTGEKPTLALDVSALGGMYANKIVLLGTENGVGARNAGSIGASAGDLVVTIDGRMENSGSLQSQGNTQISATGGVTNTGTLSAARELALTTPADVDNSSGTMNAARLAVDAVSLRNVGGTIAQTGSQGMTLDAGALSNRNGGRIGAAESAAGGSTGASGSTAGQSGGSGGGGSASDSGGGTVSGGSTAPATPIIPLADGILHISGLLDNDGGRISAAAGFDLDSSTGLSNDGGQLELRQLTLTGGNLSNQGGTLLIDGTSTIHANQINNDAGKLNFASAVAMDAQALSNRSGTLTMADSAPMTLSVAGLLDNTNGTLATNATQFTLNSGTLINEHGTINHAGSDGLALTTGDWHGAGGTVVTSGAATVSVGTVDHQGATLSATQLTLHAANLDNRGGVIATAGEASNTLHVEGTLDNSDKGAIETNGDLAISATTLGNTGGTIQQAGTTQGRAAGTLAIAATTLNGQGGTLATNGTLALSGTTTDLRNGTTYAQAVAIDTGVLTTAGGTLQAIGNGAMVVRANSAWDNTDGKVATNGALTIQAGALDNTRGTLSAAGSDATQLTIAHTFTNSGGKLASMGATTVRAGALLNQGGTIQAAAASQEGTSSASPLTITADGLLDNSAHGVLTSDGNLTVTASTLDNTQGTIAHAGDGALTIAAATLNGQNGSIASNGALTLTGNTTNLRDGTTYAQSIAIDTGSLTTAGGSLQALGTDPLMLHVHNTLDNTSGTIVGNGALALDAGALTNRNGQLTAAGADASYLRVAGLFDNTRGTLGTTGATTLHAGALDNSDGKIQAFSADMFHVTVDGQLTNERGALQTNGALDLTAGALGNHSGTIQAQQAIAAHVAGTIDNTGGLMVAGGDLDVHAQNLLNRDTLTIDPAASPTGLYGQRVTLDAATVDNRQGQVQARDALSIQGDTLTNVRGVLDGTGAVNITGMTLDNTGGQVNQRGDSGALSLTLSQGLTNMLGGRIGAEGAANLHAGSFDNSGGTTFARHDLNVSTDGDLLNRNGGVLQTNHALTINALGTLDNSGGSMGATDAAAIGAGAIANVGGQILAGNSGSADAALRIIVNSAIDNRGGTIGDRGGDATVTAASIDNSSRGTLVAQRDLNLDAVGTLNNNGGTAYATRKLSYQNGSATLDNTGGKLGAGDTTWLDLATITNSNGRIQANTIWLTTPTLTNDGGEVDGSAVHATLANLNGLGRLYGSDLLDANFTGDYTHLVSQRLESDGILSLTVAGTLTNQGTLQTAGELDLSAARLVNLAGGVINASNESGNGVVHIVATDSIDNQTGASLQGDNLTLKAHDVTNTGDITGNTLRVDAATLTNGADLGQTTDNAAYQSGLIAAVDNLSLYITDTLLNRDATLYSQGDLIIAGSDSGARTQSVTNLSGDIEARGNLVLSSQQFANARRVIETNTFTLSPAEQTTNVQTVTAPMYVYDDPLAAHQVPNIDPGQIVSAAQIAKAQAYCSANEASNDRCVFFQQGNHTGAPATYQSTTTDTLLSVTTVTAASAESRVLSGGDMALDGAVLNNASSIAAGRNLAINGQDGVASTDSVQNINWVPTGLIQTTVDDQVQSQYLVHNPRTWLLGAWWTYDTTTSSQTVLLQPGSVPGWITYAAGDGLKASITAGGDLTINGGPITNTAVGRGKTGDAITPTDVSGPESNSLHDVHGAGAGTVDRVTGASGDTVHGGGNTYNAAAQTVGNATQALPNLVPPANGIYSQNGDPGAPFLVTTAPRFAHGPVTSSDYLLRALGDDPGSIHKRLGDGYYEQNLVLDQILQLTGRKTLNGGDGLSQYTALMNDAADEAARLGLQLGAPLTTAQIGALSSDIVWLVDQVVNGEHVLVPVVYLSKATSDAMHSDGALMAGNTVNIRSSGTVRNDGTITGTQGTAISADTLINTSTLKSAGTLAIATRNDTINAGTLSGGAVSVMAGRDLINTGAVTSASDMALVAGRDLTTGAVPIQANGNLSLVAGRDLTATASTIRAGGNAQLVAGNNITLDATGHTTRTQSSQTVQENLTHNVTGISAGGNLALVADNDLTSYSAQLNAGNQLGVAAGNDIHLNTVTDSQSVTSISTSGRTVTKTATYDESVRGTTLSGTNGVVATAGHDLTATAATISSTNGAIGLMANNDLTLNTAQETHSSVTDTKKTSGNVISNSSTGTHDAVSDSYAIGTTVSGNSVTMAAGHDLTATAAQIVADHDIVMAAGNNLTLNTATDTHTEEHSVSKTKNGLMGAGVGVMVGQAKQSETATITQTTPEGTTVGSIGGSVTMSGGNNVHLTNATVLSHTGTAIVGKNVTIDAAMGTMDVTQTQKQSSSGLTLSLGGGGVSAAQGAYASVRRGSEVKDDRLKALYAAQAGYAVSDAAPGVAAMANAGSAKDAASASGVNLQLGIGGSSAKAATTSHDETAYGSTIKSNGNVLIAATGGDLNVIGSQISGDNVALAAANNINLLSLAEDHTLKSENKNASGGVGVQIGTDGIGFYAQASAGKGDAHGNGTTHANTSVDAKNTLSLVSGGDTTIQGAQAKGNSVLADIGGNLNIRSEQDTNDYASKQQQASAKVVVGYGGSVSGSYNQSDVDSHYASVTTVSGIGAGDSGYTIRVKGNTDLNGGVIASTADPAKNLLDTGSLTFANIENKADYSASSFGVAGGTGGAAGGPKGVAPNIGIPQGDDSHSITKASIASGTIITRNGETDLSGLDRNTTLDQQGLKPIFDLQKAQEQQEMGQVAGAVGFRAAGDIAGKMGWPEGSTERTVLHGVVGAGVAALGGGDVIGGAAGAAANQLAINGMAQYLVDQGYDPKSAEFATMLQAGSVAIGAVAGGGAGAATALDGTQYNYLTHQQVDALNKACKGGGASAACQQAVADANKQSDQQNTAMVETCTNNPSGNACLNAMSEAKAYSTGAYYGFNGSQLAGAGALMTKDVATSYEAYKEANYQATPILRYGNPVVDGVVKEIFSLLACGGCDVDYKAPTGSGEVTPVAFPGEVFLYGARVPATAKVEGEAASATGNTGYMFDAMNPGPLSNEAAGTFAGGRYNVGVIEATDGVLYKAGDAANAGGSYFNFFPPTSVTQARIDNAVLPNWTNMKTGALTGRSPMNSVITADFPVGTVYYYGPVGSQGGAYLGNNYNIQIFIPNGRSIGTFTPIGPLQ
ncbi:two-partner secretion domain-containing protein [Dyella sp. 2YAF14]|uniref:two-partner secretion domain-containing protein n=1 Tax=Dyella sp. 2YAF14 TaxID=3233025 RepID=UPI003F8F0F54